MQIPPAAVAAMTKRQLRGILTQNGLPVPVCPGRSKGPLIRAVSAFFASLVVPAVPGPVPVAPAPAPIPPPAPAPIPVPIPAPGPMPVAPMPMGPVIPPIAPVGPAPAPMPVPAPVAPIAPVQPVQPVQPALPVPVQPVQGVDASVPNLMDVVGKMLVNQQALLNQANAKAHVPNPFPAHVFPHVQGVQNVQNATVCDHAFLSAATSG